MSETPVSLLKGAALRQRRKEIGLTQEELARLVSLKSRAQIIKWEQGRDWPVGREPLLTDALDIANRDFFTAIAAGAEYRAALGMGAGQTLTRKKSQVIGHQDILARLALVLNTNEEEYEHPEHIANVKMRVRTRITEIVKQGLADLGKTEEEVEEAKVEFLQLDSTTSS